METVHCSQEITEGPLEDANVRGAGWWLFTRLGLWWGRECVREKDELPERLGYSGYFRWLGLNATDDAGPWR